MKRQLLPILLLLLLPALAFAQSDFDETKALAEQGDATAQYNLGVMYIEGRGISEDGIEGVKWFRLAAEQGLSEAMHGIGSTYAYGLGVPENTLRAYIWHSLATANGYERAKEFRDIAAGRLAPEQLSTGQELATKCYESGFKDCPY